MKNGPEMHVTFRFDASPEIGGGHAMRCLTLADAMEQTGWQCCFAVGAETIATVPALAMSQHKTITLTENTHQQLSTITSDLLIVDHYGLDAVFEQNCRPFCKQIMVIDDMANRPHECDILLDQNLGRTKQDYAGLLPEKCQTLLGPDFALLRPQFNATRAAAVQHRLEKQEVSRIFVNLGATDANNVTATVLTGIQQAEVDVAVDVVLGAAAPHLKALHALTEKMSDRVKIHVAVEDMAGLMMQADLAIGAAGTTSWERCCLGLPTLLLVIADNQILIADNLEKHGAVLNLGWHETVSSRKIAEELNFLSANPEQLSNMSRSSMAICDGLGSKRVIETVLKILS